MDRPHRSECTAGWWTTSGRSDFAICKGHGNGYTTTPYWWKKYQSMGIVMTLFVVRIISFCFLHVVDVSALSICIVLACFCCCDFYVFVVCEFGVESQS